VWRNTTHLHLASPEVWRVLADFSRQIASRCAREEKNRLFLSHKDRIAGCYARTRGESIRRLSNSCSTVTHRQGRAVARFGAAREIHTLYKTGVQQHPLRRRSRLRKPLPCCAEEFDRARPSIAWRRALVCEMQTLTANRPRSVTGRLDIWEVFSQPLRGLRPVVPSIATACSTRQ